MLCCTHGVEALVNVQLRVIVAAPVLHGLGGAGPLALPQAGPVQGTAAQPAVEGHAHRVLAPGQLVPHRAQAMQTHLDGLGTMGPFYLITEEGKGDREREIEGEIFLMHTEFRFGNVYVTSRSMRQCK